MLASVLITLKILLCKRLFNKSPTLFVLMPNNSLKTVESLKKRLSGIDTRTFTFLFTYGKIEEAE